MSSSAKLLSFPTYLFMGVVMVMLVAGAVKAFGGTLPALSPEEQTRLLAPTLEAEGGHLMAIGPVLLMRAFSSGCAALTGIEAISDSVAAFRPVEWRNARKVLTVMVLLLATMFGGISALAHHTGIVYAENGPTLLYQLGQLIFGNGVLLAVLQLATLLILLLAANTAYADFPRLAAFLAQDGFLPRQLASLGDRLVFSNGIFALSSCAALLLVIFNASVTRLIPLFVKQFEQDHRKDRNRFCMIVLPVFVTQHRWENLLHNQSTILLRQALREQGTRVVTTVGFYL